MREEFCEIEAEAQDDEVGLWDYEEPVSQRPISIPKNRPRLSTTATPATRTDWMQTVMTCRVSRCRRMNI
jgi:hypothetical protein